MWFPKLMEDLIQKLENNGFSAIRGEPTNYWDVSGREDVVCQNGHKRLRAIINFEDCLSPNKPRYRMNVVVNGRAFDFESMLVENIITKDEADVLFQAALA